MLRSAGPPLPSHLPQVSSGTHLTFPLDAGGSLSLSPALTPLPHIQLPPRHLPGALQAPHGPHAQNGVFMAPPCPPTSWVPISVNDMHPLWRPGQHPPCLRACPSVFRVHPSPQPAHAPSAGGPPPRRHPPRPPSSPYTTASLLHRIAEGSSAQIRRVRPLLSAERPIQGSSHCSPHKARPLHAGGTQGPGHPGSSYRSSASLTPSHGSPSPRSAPCCASSSTSPKVTATIWCLQVPLL